jgi:DNA polymerase III epsilon subunit-like protein
MPRLLAVKFHTNGMPDDQREPKPYANMPTLVAVYAATPSGPELLYASDISGATRMNTWVHARSATTPAKLATAPSFAQVVHELTALTRADDILVFHKALYDRNTVLADAAQREGVDVSTLMGLSCYCTCQDPGARNTFGRCPSLAQLCDHFRVSLRDEFTAKGCAKALAECLSAAVRTDSPISLDIAVVVRDRAAVLSSACVLIERADEPPAKTRRAKKLPTKQQATHAT